MSLKQNFSKMSARSRSWFVFGLVIALALVASLVVAGDSYNRFSNYLADKTNDIIVLPEVKALPFSLGLDLQGGAHLVYLADMSGIEELDRDEALESARDIIERRVNLFGVSEPVVQANKTADGEYRIIAELAGIKNVQDAIAMIGETPILEFKEQDEAAISEIEKLIADNYKASSTNDGLATTTASTTTNAEDISISEEDLLNLGIDANSGWKSSGLTGKYLKRSTVQFNPNDGSPEISLEFNPEGAALFEEITARNIGRPVAIFLDGYPINIPNVNEKITGGQAVISGTFTIDEAKDLVKRLNSGALPVPISLIAEKTVEASLGSKSISNSLQAGLIGLLLVSIFLIIAYRLPGLLSVISLIVYGMLVLAIFKALPLWLALFLIILLVALIFYVFDDLKIFNGSLALMFSIFGLLLFFYALQAITLTVAGIAGFILSLGMAVDANILIFSRVKEELKLGKTVSQAVDEGFKRAWPSIRDGNFSTILTCFILMFFGTSTIQGFGTTLFIGIVISLFSAIVVTKLLLSLVSGPWLDKRPWLFGVKAIDDNK
ncbi:preprotein translocase subunit SecD [Candidatus Falkowbacteria bacterium]|nr:preprotein translocase subunit SecD [Candidatus Falkowbacteria bacterium]NCT54428.1 preprotein translocase subunit SecD [Candidatus Falkowbacteria bacterium]